MSELILHHYPTSPFAEKARLLLGFKGLSWRDAGVAGGGGYLLRHGADCPSPGAGKGVADAVPRRSRDGRGNVRRLGRFGRLAVALVFQPESAAVRFARFSPEQAKAFMADRAGLFSGGSATRVPLEEARHSWPTLMARLEQQLQREEGDFLFGEPSIADFSMAHILWFLKATPVTSPLVDDYPAVSAWLGRVLGFGHGASKDMTSEEAVQVARDTVPAALPEERFIDPNGFTVGQQVVIAATDYGVDPVAGELVFVGSEELILRREDERVGVVHVHFPRLGFRIEAS